MKKILLLVAMMATFIGLSAQNPYAYKLSAGNQNDEGITIHYTLNTAAQAVQLQLLDGETVVKAIDLDGDLLAAGDHEYVLNFAENPEIPAGKPISWNVAVTGAVIETPVEITNKVLKFYSPAGVAVDVNPESENFGMMYVTESYASASSSYYTATASGSVGIGLYQFDPQFNGIKNAEGKYGFSCGMQSAGTTLVDWRPARMQISEDGRMFILSQRVNTGYPLYEINRETLQATPFFNGTLDTSTGIVTNGDVEVAAGVGVAFDVIGSGENLKLMMMTCTPGTTTDVTKYKTNEYNIGTATSWGEAPSRNFTAFDNKAINYAGINLAYDGAGGIWMSQWRGAPTDGEPSYAHASLETEMIDQLITDVYSRNGGMAFNKDHTLMVRGEGYSKKLVVYSVDNGALTKLYEYSCPSFTGWNQFAFDYANNIIACDNSAEVFGMIQLPNEGAVATPCIEEYYFEIPAQEEPGIEELYIVGTFNNWNYEEEDGGRIAMVANEEGTEFTGTVELEANGEFKLVTPREIGWQWFGGESDNGMYFLINSDMLDINITLIDGANFRVEEAGKYDLKVMSNPSKAIQEPLVMVVTKNTEPPTAITTINTDKVDNAWYNMSGIRFESKPTAPGIYIHNGKKVIIK
ncbi:MAG: hypothetical protein IKW83_07865 [Muribaculaceae bacterium]|nr:hypothetical protein [Muribaculaceae bacterium]